MRILCENLYLAYRVTSSATCIKMSRAKIRTRIIARTFPLSSCLFTPPPLTQRVRQPRSSTKQAPKTAVGSADSSSDVYVSCFVHIDSSIEASW